MNNIIIFPKVYLPTSAPESWELWSHTCSNLLTNFSHLAEKFVQVHVQPQWTSILQICKSKVVQTKNKWWYFALTLLSRSEKDSWQVLLCQNTYWAWNSEMCGVSSEYPLNSLDSFGYSQIVFRNSSKKSHTFDSGKVGRYIAKESFIALLWIIDKTKEHPD